MKLLEEAKYFRKEPVHDSYASIVEDFKDYEKVSKVQMIKEIFDVYSDYENIINICTYRELVYLKKVLNNEKDLTDEKYKFEKDSLMDKYLICSDIHSKGISYVVPEEIEENVKKAVSNYKAKEVKECDRINEFLVSYCEIQGVALVDNVISVGCAILNIEPEIIKEHITNNKVFKFYIFIEKVDVEDLGPTWLGFYKEYYHLVDLIMEGKRDYSIGLAPSFDVRDYETLFYNDFNIRNKKIKRFYEKLKELPFFWFNSVPYIKQYAVLNKERESLKESISDVGALKDYDLAEFFKLMDEAMDEMPSGVLNGLTPNQLKEKQNKEVARQIAKEKSRIRQKDACLSSKNADLFYELYFAVLDFVNKKYSINNKLKIYRGKGLDPNELSAIVDKFWSEKDSIIDEFCNKNLYKFNDEELEMVKEFKKGIRDMFIICDYLEDYTAVMGKDRCYMIKGLTCNIDEVIEYDILPAPTMMIIFPFKDVLVYDGMIATYPIKIGSAMEDMIMADYNKSIKYYHL